MKRANGSKLGAHRLLGLCALGVAPALAGCGSSVPDEPGQQSPALSGVERQLPAAVRELGATRVLDGRLVPAGLRRATPDEVKEHFDRIDRRRESARLEAQRPLDLEAVLARIAASTNRTERASLADTYLETINQMDVSERTPRLARLREVWEAGQAR